jgi:hypothetical protein
MDSVISGNVYDHLVEVGAAHTYALSIERRVVIVRVQNRTTICDRDPLTWRHTSGARVEI